MSVTFGYMVLCIIIKWNIDWTGDDDPISIISLFIDFTSVEKALFWNSLEQETL